AADGDAYALVLDADRKPKGWRRADGRVNGVVPLGSTFTPAQSLRAALDGALVSPTEEAVCVDGDGRYLGVVSHTDIARHLVESAEAPAGRP
ncbi:MAG: ABC transporter ATP-binding protein, partial [Actinomycetota bacterium]|nr:ABC transporter ATP-binding protein [Actinomycetota bacterium]